MVNARLDSDSNHHFEMDNSFGNKLKEALTSKNSKKRSLTDECISDYILPAKVGKSSSLPITPKKKENGNEEPLTPTANLKMLVSAAFGIAKTRDRQKRELFQDDDDDEYFEDSCSTVSDPVDERQDELAGDGKQVSNGNDALSNSRKMKSLGLLCTKFLSKYPNGSEGNVINLHDIARELNVERRRIYDIVNVLESLEYVTKRGKNTYTWHGSGRLVPTLRKLKALADKIYGQSREGAKSNENSPDNIGPNSQLNVPSIWLENGIKIKDDEDEAINPSTTKQEEDSSKRKNKSLGIFCQKLIMLFMVSQNHVIALDEAAKEVIELGGEKMEKNNKTKVRRLYDIANILTSMGLIEKTATYLGSRKAAFKWVGVELDSLQPDTETIDKTLNGENEFLPTKHSLFSHPSSVEINKQGLCSSLRKLETRSFSAGNIDVKRRNKMPRTKSAAVISRKRLSNDGAEQENERKTGTVCLSQKSKETEVCLTKKDDFQANGGALDLKVESPIRTKKIENDDISPNERSFREEVWRLQKRFPDKMQDKDGLLHLLTAGNELQKNENEEKGSRCNLLKRIGEESNTARPSIDAGDAETLQNVQVQSPKEEFNNKSLSATCFNVIIDELKDKSKALTLRHGIEKAIKDASKSANLGHNIKPVIVKENKANQSWNCYPYHVSPTVQKTSVGVQASLLDGVSPLKPLNQVPNSPNTLKRSFEDSHQVTSSAVNTDLASSSCISPLRSLKMPIYSINGAVNTTLSKYNVKPNSSYVLLGFKSSKTQKVMQSSSDAVSSIARGKGMQLKSSTSSATSSPRTSSNCSDKAPHGAPIFAKMLPIPQTPFEMSEDQENCRALQSSKPRFGQLKNTATTPPARFLLPLQVLNGEGQKFTPPVLLPKVQRDVMSEETPIRAEFKESNQVKAQRKLTNSPGDDF